MGVNDQILVILNSPQDILIDSGGPVNRKIILNQATEQLIIEEARKLNYSGRFKIIVQLSSAAIDKNDLIRSAISNHFTYSAQKQHDNFKYTLRTGWWSLLVGFIFLAIMYFIIRFITPYLPEGGFLITLRELFIILGWVALWRPAELLLYEWYPFLRDARLFRKIQRSNVNIVNLAN